MLITLLFKKIRKPQRGVNVPLVVVSLPMLIGFMAVAIYTGITAYVSDATHNVVQNAALAGASAMGTDPAGTQQTALFTSFAGGSPLPHSLDICQQVAARQIAANPMLSSIGFAVGCSEGFVIEGNALNDGNTLRAVGSATVPGGPLSLIGMPTLDFEAIGAAIHHKQEVNGGGQFLPNTMTWPAFGTCSRHEPELGFIEIRGFSTPITDRPGNDLEIIPQYLRGYSLEGCAGGTCYDILRAANPQSCSGGMSCYFGSYIPPGASDTPGQDYAERNWMSFNGQLMGKLDIPRKGERAISYGSVVVDLGGNGSRQGLGYGGGVRHITHFIATDDGVPISYDPSAEGYWHTVCADNTTAMIGTITSPYHAVAGFLGPVPTGRENSSMVHVAESLPPGYVDGNESGAGTPGAQGNVVRPTGPTP